MNCRDCESNKQIKRLFFVTSVFNSYRSNVSPNLFYYVYYTYYVSILYDQWEYYGVENLLSHNRNPYSKNLTQYHFTYPDVFRRCLMGVYNMNEINK